MLKLLKYEIKKGYQLKIVVAAITLLVECIYLFGLYSKKYDLLVGLAIFGLVLCAIFGTLVIVLSSIQTLWRELNTKQSYMMFMTPHSSYEILGAKLAESILSLACTGALYIILAVIDLQLMSSVANENMIRWVFEMFGIIDLSVMDIITIVFALMAQALLLYTTAYFAVVIASTLFNGKSYGSWLSIGLYLVLNSAVTYIGEKLMHFNQMAMYLNVRSLYCLVFVCVFYLLSAWLMDRMLSV